MRISEVINEDYAFAVKRRKLNVPYLIQQKALYITFPHGENGWETDIKEEWAYSVITHYNVVGGGWAQEAPKYLKPISYKDAATKINTSKPNLGNSDLIYDTKYIQILWSIKKLNLDTKKAFLT